MKVALITGISGQDGSYLSEILLEDKYVVYGIIRYSSNGTTRNIDHLLNSDGTSLINLRYGDVTDLSSIIRVLEEIKLLNPEILHVYNLAGQTHVKVSFDTPLYTTQVDAIGTLNVLEAVRATGLGKLARVYQASTSEMFGKVQEVPQKETTPFYPRSPYGVSKLYSYWIMRNYRESYGMFCAQAIIFNHESVRRPKLFVTRKITSAVSNIMKGKQKCLTLGNLDAKRDWGYAKDYCRGMKMILEHTEPDDFVLATGEYHSVREFVELAFRYVGIELEWKGTGMEEIGVIKSVGPDKSYNKSVGDVVVKLDPKFTRPAEVEELLGDSTKARMVLGWKPSVSFIQLVEMMMKHDMSDD